MATTRPCEEGNSPSALPCSTIVGALTCLLNRLIEPDAKIAFRACSNRNGMIFISGTGSICFSYKDDEEKRMWFIKLTRQGGLSKIFGDDMDITKTSMTVYPNPSRDIFHVYTDRQLTNVKYQVFSSTGKLLLTGHCEDSNDISISLSGYPAGLYLLHVSSADKNAGQTVKLVKTE